MDGTLCGFKWNFAPALQQRSEFKGIECTGLVEGRQKTHRSKSQRGRSPMVSMQVAMTNSCHISDKCVAEFVCARVRR